MNSSTIELPPGLKGAVVAHTELSDVRGDEGFFHYRQYNAVDLARSRSFEDTWQLMWNGQLPDRHTSHAFSERLRSVRRLPDAIVSPLRKVATIGTPIDALRTSLSLLGALRGSRSVLDLDEGELRAEAFAIAASVAPLVAGIHRVRRGHDPIAGEPDPDLGHAGAYLQMLTGRRPSPAVVNALERYLVLTIDHGFNASTFAARVIISTGPDIGAAVVGALGALSGPLHGGAPSRCLDAIDAIGTPDRAGAWVRTELAAGRRLMGFGHAVYRVEDPRAALLRETALELGGPRVETALALEAAALEHLAIAHPERSLPTNVELWAAVVLDACGLDADLFTPTFTVSRVIGWCAHILEQVGEHTLIRPSARYVGPVPPVPVPSAT